VGDDHQVTIANAHGLQGRRVSENVSAKFRARDGDGFLVGSHVDNRRGAILMQGQAIKQGRECGTGSGEEHFFDRMNWIRQDLCTLLAKFYEDVPKDYSQK